MIFICCEGGREAQKSNYFEKGVREEKLGKLISTLKCKICKVREGNVVIIKWKRNQMIRRFLQPIFKLFFQAFHYTFPVFSFMGVQKESFENT